jgi:hypothetical protein
MYRAGWVHHNGWTLIAKGQRKAHELPTLEKQIYWLFYGAFHHQHFVEGLFAAMRFLNNGHLLAGTLQARKNVAGC